MTAAKKKTSALAPEPLQQTFEEIRAETIRRGRTDDNKIIGEAVLAFEAWMRNRDDRDMRWLAQIAVRRELSPLAANMEAGSDRSFVAAFVQMASVAMDLSATWEAQMLALPVASGLAAALRHERKLDLVGS